MLRRDYIEKLRSGFGTVAIESVDGFTIDLDKSVFTYYSTTNLLERSTDTSGVIKLPFTKHTIEAFRDATEMILTDDVGSSVVDFRLVLKALEVCVYFDFKSEFINEILSLFRTERNRSLAIMMNVLYNSTRFSDAVLGSIATASTIRVLWLELLKPRVKMEMSIKEFRTRLLSDSWFRTIISGTEAGKILIPIYNKFLESRDILNFVTHQLSLETGQEILDSLGAILTRELCDGTSCTYQTLSLLTRETKHPEFLMTTTRLKTTHYLRLDLEVECLSSKCVSIGKFRFDPFGPMNLPPKTEYLVIRTIL